MLFWRISPSVRVLSVTGNPALLLSLKGRKAKAAFVRRDRWEWRPFSAGRECQKLGSKSRTQPCCRTWRNAVLIKLLLLVLITAAQPLNSKSVKPCLEEVSSQLILLFKLISPCYIVNPLFGVIQRPTVCGSSILASAISYEKSSPEEPRAV